MAAVVVQNWQQPDRRGAIIVRASGNGLKQVCVQNLLAIRRGEVVFDRLRGLDARLIDRPSRNAAAELRQDAEWVVKTYEPRATIESIEVGDSDGSSGDFAVTANIR